MSNIYGLLTIGQNALLTQQKAIDITGNNIANVNTPGYSRQRLIMVQNSPVRIGQATMSTGVHADQKIQRFHDQFVVNQLNAENEGLGRWESRKNALEKAETMFDEVSGYGLNAAMSDFWNAWQNVANNPSGHVERVSLVNASQYLSNTFGQLRASLTELQEDIDTNVDNIVAKVNEIAGQIAELNLKITQVEVNGHNANDYLDQRDQLTFELSKLIDIESFEDESGHLTVMVGGGKPLVEKSSTWTLSTTDSGGVQNILWHASNGATTDVTDRIDSGQLRGYIESRDDTIAGYISDLDTLAGTLISEVNGLHSSGYALDGTQNDFFTGTDAATMGVNPAIEADANLIAAAADPAGLPGDNTNAIAIANLQNGLTMSGNTATFDNFYNSLVGEVGNDTQSALFNHDHQTSMIGHLEQRRQEVSGVSLDEEMVNLVKFQHAYNAAAKLITTTDELLDTLLTIKR